MFARGLLLGPVNGSGCSVVIQAELVKGKPRASGHEAFCPPTFPVFFKLFNPGSTWKANAKL